MLVLLNMDQNEIKKFVKEERAFLHDIATPVGTVTLLVDMLTERLHELGNLDDEVKQLNVLQKSIERLNILIQDRRKILIERSD